MDNIRDQIKLDTGVDLPIIGGTGNSIDDPIVIDPDYEDWSDVMYSYIKVIYYMQGKGWKVEKQQTIEHNVKMIDKLSVVVEGDEANFHNHYFDVTKQFNNGKLFGGGSNFVFPWEKEINRKKRIKIS